MGTLSCYGFRRAARTQRGKNRVHRLAGLGGTRSGKRFGQRCNGYAYYRQAAVQHRRNRFYFVCLKRRKQGARYGGKERRNPQAGLA